MILSCFLFYAAFVNRGKCTFVQKILALQSAGAVGVIVANDSDDANNLFVMGGDMRQRKVSIPAVMTSKNGGKQLCDCLSKDPLLHVSLEVFFHAWLPMGATEVDEDRPLLFGSSTNFEYTPLSKLWSLRVYEKNKLYFLDIIRFDD